jgi:hypothetical protein
MKKIIITSFLLSFLGLNVLADGHKSPWKFMQGRWQVEEEYGFKSEVVFKKLKDGEGASGKWEDQDGNKFSELIGWLSDKKQVVSLGFGTNGAYWECNFTEVTAEHVKGTMMYRDHDGKLHQGDYMIKKVSNVLFESEFKTKDSKDGKLNVYKGTFKRVVKTKK